MADSSCERSSLKLTTSSACYVTSANLSNRRSVRRLATHRTSRRRCCGASSVSSTNGSPAPPGPTHFGGLGEAEVLRTNVSDWSADELWRTYIQLTDAEAAFRIHKTDLSIRPIWHQKTDRVLAHIFVCFLAYVMWKTLEQWQKRAGLGDSPRTILEELKSIQSTDVVLPIDSQPPRELRVRCVVRPDKAQSYLLDRLGLRLPERLRPTPLLAKM